jgi:vacuolar-type H+-ATPase subunit H
MLTPKLLNFSHHMTVLDQVLQAEQDAATKVATATAAATQQIADAKNASAAAIAAETVRLAAHETVTLAEHAHTVELNSKTITTQATKDAAAISVAFAEKKTELERKINEALS